MKDYHAQKEDLIKMAEIMASELLRRKTITEEEFYRYMRRISIINYWARDKAAEELKIVEALVYELSYMTAKSHA